MAATHTVNNIIGLLGVQFKRIANDFAIRIHRRKKLEQRDNQWSGIIL